MHIILRNNVPTGEYDNIKTSKYKVPDYWDIGEVFERLIEDVSNSCLKGFLVYRLNYG